MEETPFLEDIYPHNLLYAVTIRSPVAKGVLKSIEKPALPDHYVLITAKDIPGENRLEETNMPILAEKALTYIGEPVAILLGHDKAKLFDLAARCKVEANEEEPVFNSKDTRCITEATREMKIGDTEGVYEKTGKIVTGSYTTGIQEHWYAEPIGAVAWYNDTEGKKKTERTIVVRTATQWTYHVKRSAARALGMDSSLISVEPTLLNLHMDGKLWYPSLVSCHACLGVYITKKPVRLILNREEDFLFTPKRCSTNIDIASLVDEKGNIMASELDITVNLGSYGVNSNEILDQICLGALGLYKTGILKLTAKANRTNIPPQGPFSGFGLSQGTFAIERHISHIANAFNVEPAAWREERIDPKVMLPSIQNKNEISENELINTVVKMSDYYRKRASFELLRQVTKNKPEKGDNPRGIGIAIGFQGNGLLYCGEDKGNYIVEVTLTAEKTLEIKTSITTSDDYKKIWRRIASEIMPVEPENVHIISVNAPDSGPSCSSRNISVITKLVEKCCHVIRKQCLNDPLPITVRRSVRPQSGSFWNGNFSAPEGKIMDINGFVKPGLAAAVVEVAIDLVECVPIVRGVWIALDGGKVISINRAKRSVMRGVTQSLGWAFNENIEYIDGFLPRSQYDNFSILSPKQIPPVKVEFLTNNSNDIKGIGDLPSACIPAAFLQAVSQAMDYCYKSIPLKRKDIWEIVKFRNSENAGHK